eukprot:TRINITY_DN2079_c0_g2_i1.p1 TRINITY_DN2079_c0_g2~~TRINITY_DN2079_c0_g2_i1.p1  ORF type:complete len:271 (+),score=53.60 TRINITY_DN2079_c0_g2_i1:70-813(+)
MNAINHCPAIVIVLVLSILQCTLCTPTPPTGGTTIDIHVQLTPQMYWLAVGLSEFILAKLPNDQIVLGPKGTIPHITLYLTQFQDVYIKNITEQVYNMIESNPEIRACPVMLENSYVSDSWGMLNVSTPNCLQQMSDLIVNATYLFITPNQTVPSWVYSLPEPERSEKIEMVKKYGSPNVFSQFQPHVTIAYDDVDTDPSIEQIFEILPYAPPYLFFPDLIGIGNVGDFGTVLDNDYGLFPLNISNV